MTISHIIVKPEWLAADTAYGSGANLDWLVNDKAGAQRSLPRRLNRRGGASVVRREAAISRTEDLDVKICEEAITRKI